MVAYFFTSLFWNPETWPEQVKEARSFPYVVEGAKWLRDLIPEEAIKNLGLKTSDKEEEEAVSKDGSLDHIVKSLSQPSPSAVTKETEKAEDKPKASDKKSE